MAAANGDRTTILGCTIDRLDADAIVGRVEQVLTNGGSLTIASVTKAKLVAMQRDAELRQVVEAADVVTAEDRGVVLASKLARGKGLPGHVEANELMRRLLGLAAQSGHRVYVLGGALGVLERAIFVAGDRYPGLQVVGHHHGYFYGSREEAAVAEEISAQAPDLLFVALPSPRKEYWIGRYGGDLGAKVVMGVGEDWTDHLVPRPQRGWRQAAGTNATFAGLLARSLTGRSEPLADRRATDRRATDRRNREHATEVDRRRSDRRGSGSDPRGTGAE